VENLDLGTRSPYPAGNLTTGSGPSGKIPVEACPRESVDSRVARLARPRLGFAVAVHAPLVFVESLSATLRARARLLRTHPAIEE
jgi:hypothetical protein